MHGYRAPRAFDGERFLDGGALVLVEGGAELDAGVKIPKGSMIERR